MKTYGKYSLVIAAMILLYSCQDVIQIKLQEGSKMFVIDAFVTDLRSDQVIRITTNDTYFSNASAPPVGNASVVLEDLTLNKSYNFVYKGDGNYVYPITLNDTIGYVDHQYRLKVNIEGSEYTAQTGLKRKAQIDSVHIISNNGDFSNKTEDTTYVCLLYAKDKADNNPDFYWIKTFRNDTLFNEPADLNFCIDGTGGVVKDAPSSWVNFTPPATFLAFKNYRRNDSIKVEIHAITKETYFFFVQTANQINNQGLFATTPENVKTNIITPDDAKTKAVGRFSMAGVASYKRIIKP